MPKFLVRCLALVVALAAGSAGASATGRTPKTRKLPAATRSNPAPAAAHTDLNSPATDFSGVAPVIDDPAAERLKPRKEKDPTFD